MFEYGSPKINYKKKKKIVITDSRFKFSRKRDPAKHKLDFEKFIILRNEDDKDEPKDNFVLILILPSLFFRKDLMLKINNLTCRFEQGPIFFNMVWLFFVCELFYGARDLKFPSLYRL